MSKPDHATEVSDLNAYELGGTWVVEDQVGGGVWWPGDEAATQIREAADPSMKARELCLSHPGMGEWRS